MLSLKEAQIEQRKYFGMIYNIAIIENDRKNLNAIQIDQK